MVLVLEVRVLTPKFSFCNRYSPYLTPERTNVIRLKFFVCFRLSRLVLLVRQTSGLLRRVGLVCSDVSAESAASVFSVTYFRSSVYVYIIDTVPSPCHISISQSEIYSPWRWEKYGRPECSNCLMLDAVITQYTVVWGKIVLPVCTVLLKSKVPVHSGEWSYSSTHPEPRNTM
jgi:hypothetical protein